MSNLTDKSKIVVIIPAYEPSRVFIDYAKQILNRGFGGLVVVDDGSGEKFNGIFSELAALDGCEVVSYEKNQGKGFALKTAFKHCKDNYDESFAFVTADCDGQHLVEDVENVANTALEHKSKLILGSRDFCLEQVPARSKAGNLNIRRLFKFFYGLSLSDTQTGLRAFSYSLLDRLISVRGNRFEYEMNMLIVLHKAHTDILEVPITTVYNQKAEDVDKVSHFKTFSDSLRVTATLFQNLGWYVISSVLSSLVDVASFFLLATFVFVRPESVAYNMLFATVGARVLSSIVNFIFNFKFVFNGKSKKSIVKYYMLWAVQLATSYGIACFWNSIFDNATVLTAVQITLLTTLLKGICDLCVALVSYQVQSRWVFVSAERSHINFYGARFGLARAVVNLFSKRYTSFVIPDEDEPCVYVCRHLNTKGPMKVYQHLTFDVHALILHTFFSFTEAYRHYCSYTFNKKYPDRNKASVGGRIKAFFSALLGPAIARSAKAIPVYRGGADSIITYRKAMEYLEKRENIIVYPDINYTAGENKKSDIYSGFLYLEKLWYGRTGKHLKFKVLHIDSQKREITSSDAVQFPDGEHFKDAMPSVAQEIADILMQNTK